MAMPSEKSIGLLWPNLILCSNQRSVGVIGVLQRQG